jgi:SAM-dependent methyltransferase
VDVGFEVTGVDTPGELLELARMNVPKAHFVHASIYDTEIRDHDAVVAVGEPLTYHPEENDANGLVRTFFQRVADALPPGGLLIFEVIGLGEPSLAGRTWSSGDDWAVLTETTESQTASSLVRNIEVFRRIHDSYRRSHEVHRVHLFDVSLLRDQLSFYGFATETSRSYGAQQPPPRRHAFFASRLATTGSSKR